MNRSSNKKILLVEDEVDVVDLLTLHLRKADGYLLSVAHDGAEGLKKARAELPALIVLDLMLPRMSGLDSPTMPRISPAVRSRSIPHGIKSSSGASGSTSPQLSSNS